MLSIHFGGNRGINNKRWCFTSRFPLYLEPIRWARGFLLCLFLFPRALLLISCNRLHVLIALPKWMHSFQEISHHTSTQLDNPNICTHIYDTHITANSLVKWTLRFKKRTSCMDAYQRVVSGRHDNLAKLASVRNLLFVLWRDFDRAGGWHGICLRPTSVTADSFHFRRKRHLSSITNVFTVAGTMN